MPFAVQLCRALRDPALRDTLPDFQTCYLLLLRCWSSHAGWQTHRTVRVFAAETACLHRAVDAIAAQQPERIDADGARLREFSATLHAMQTMGRELTDSCKANGGWSSSAPNRSPR